MKFDIFKNYDSIEHVITEKNPNVGYDFSMALHTGEEKKKIVSNRLLLEDFFESNSHYIVATQTHSDIVYVVVEHNDKSWRGESAPEEADALITNLPNTVLTILTADCVPILIYDPVCATIGAVHAGWRGTEQNIIGKTIQKMADIYGSVTSDIIVGIGPAIGKCCYEVDHDVARHFMDYPDAVIKTTDDKYMIDLKQINRYQLVEAGVQDANIETSSICTSCQNDRFFSYRKEQGCSGRFISAISIKS